VIIAVTGLNTASEPEAGFGVLQSLNGNSKRNYQLIGLAYKPLDTGLFHSGLMNKAFIVPFPGADQEAFLKRIKQIKKESGLDIIIPAIEEEVNLFIDMEPQLRATGIALLLPARRSLRELKSELNRQLEKQKDLSAKDDNNDPTVLPPSLIKNPVSEQAALNSSSVPDYFALTVIANSKSKIVAISSIKKILLSRYGGTWMALTVDNDEFISLAAEIVKAASWQGTLTIEITRNQQGEQFISGFRQAFPDWISLTPMAGANLPAILIDVISGKKLKGITQTLPGKILVRSSIDVVTDLNHFGNISLNGEITYDHK
jgi:carbamoyl-phosphate synthase large subunit